MDKVKAITQRYPNITIFDNQEAIAQWDKFYWECWNAHPMSQASRWLRPSWYKTNVARKLVAFDGEFDEFIFFDADTLVMKSVDDVFDKLKSYDLVFDDWEHKKREPLTELDIKQVAQDLSIAEEQIYPVIHCVSFWGSKPGVFSYKNLDNLRKKLITEKKISWIKDKSWWSDSALFCCMTLINKPSRFNFTQSDDSRQRTGNCANADNFVTIDNVLYNEDGLKPIHRLHYMTYGVSQFQNLCKGIDEPIQYKDIFLHYRFIFEPEHKPSQLRPKKVGEVIIEKVKKLQGKIKRAYM
nr:alpha-1,3-mannosyltransferase family protein [Nostoc sp. MS1]